MKIGKVIISFALALFLVINSAWAKQQKRDKKNPWITARSFAVLDSGNGKILSSRRPHLRLPSASTVKVMTALVVLEKADFDQPVKVSHNAALAQPSKAYLTEGADYSVYDLLQALLLASANDAAVALAEATAGSEANFAQLMNEKAKKLGMKNTFFVNASGLPDPQTRQYSCAYDLAVMMRHAIKNPIIAKLISKKSAAITGSDGKQLFLNNHNKLLKEHAYILGKTGYTVEARHCFVGVGQLGKRGISFAILGSSKPWQDIRRLTGYSRKRERKR